MTMREEEIEGEGTGASAARRSDRSAPAAKTSPMWSSAVSHYGIVIFFVIVCAVFSFTEPSRFATVANITELLNSQSIAGIFAIGVLFPLVVGELDLSVAANLGFCSVLSAYLASKGLPTLVFFLAALGVGTLIGVVNAFVVIRFGVSSFICTLATSTVLAGGNLWLTGGTTLSLGIGPGLTKYANTEVGDVQVTVFYFAAFALIAWYIFEHTPYGRYLRATGFGRDAARLSGVRTSRHLASAFIVVGLISGACGFLETANFGSATPSTGPSFLLPAYAAAFLGATMVKHGVFNVWGTVIAVLLLAVGINGLTLFGAPNWLSYVFNGGALLIAVSIASLIRRHREAA